MAVTTRDCEQLVSVALVAPELAATAPDRLLLARPLGLDEVLTGLLTAHDPSDLELGSRGPWLRLRATRDGTASLLWQTRAADK